MINVLLKLGKNNDPFICNALDNLSGFHQFSSTFLYIENQSHICHYRNNVHYVTVFVVWTQGSVRELLVSERSA